MIILQQWGLDNTTVSDTLSCFPDWFSTFLTKNCSLSKICKTKVCFTTVTQSSLETEYSMKMAKREKEFRGEIPLQTSQEDITGFWSLLMG